jgi:transposase
MFDEPVAEPPAPEDEDQEIRGHKRKKPGRKPLPEDLPREHVYHDIDEAEKLCGCGEQLVQIGEETSEQLDIVPAKAKVLVHHRIKWACRCCEGVETKGGTVKIAPVPPQILPKSFATPGLLAHIFTAKFVDSLPFYRQEKQLARMGIELKRATMCNWAVQIAQKCQKVTQLLLEKVKQGVYLQIDETTVQVMKEPGRKNRTKSYMWLIRGGPPDPPIILFHYHPTRQSIVPQELLKGYQGYVQSDGYKGYDFLEKQEGVTLLACMAHARRKFADVWKASGKKTADNLALEGLRFFKRLYASETRFRKEKLSFDEIKQAREKEAVPILDALHKWLKRYETEVLPDSLLGRAIGYALKLWERLIRYIEEGYLNIDNNPVENAIRPFVIGRRNWLFSGSPAGASASATLYSLVATAKANSWDPYMYLRFLFTGLMTATTDEDFQGLLPTCEPRGL